MGETEGGLFKRILSDASAHACMHVCVCVCARARVCTCARVLCSLGGRVYVCACLCSVYACVYSTSAKSIWKLFIEQFDDLLVKILLGAAIISFVSSSSTKGLCWQSSQEMCGIT